MFHYGHIWWIHWRRLHRAANIMKLASCIWEQCTWVANQRLRRHKNVYINFILYSLLTRKSCEFCSLQKLKNICSIFRLKNVRPRNVRLVLQSLHFQFWIVSWKGKREWPTMQFTNWTHLDIFGEEPVKHPSIHQIGRRFEAELCWQGSLPSKYQGLVQTCV